ncbi:hypothetical protein M8J77_004867 [Diaphorina citri]|nr:hypothetical protein M8J77_004867 [Diaphorina citri]
MDCASQQIKEAAKETKTSSYYDKALSLEDDLVIWLKGSAHRGHLHKNAVCPQNVHRALPPFAVAWDGLKILQKLQMYKNLNRVYPIHLLSRLVSRIDDSYVNMSWVPVAAG